jgi:ADP-heptose:LPS heptosyltransferase
MASRTPSRLLLAGLALQRLVALRPRRPTAPRRILVAHHLYLGDTLMLTPLLAKLRHQYPDAEIVMTTPTPIAPLYQRRPYGVDAVPYDPRDIASLRALSRGPGYDLALVPGDNRYSWLARALGARWIVAFAGDRPAYKSWPVTEFARYPNQPAAWGDMTAGMISGPPPPVYDPSQWPAPAYRPFEPPRSPYCVLHIGASSALKLWPAENWRTLAQRLADRGLNIVWSGGRGEEKIINDVDPDRRFTSYAGRLDLAQLWHLLAQASLLVSPDTGVAHLGRIVGIPTLTLFGPGSQILCGAGDFWRDSSYRAISIDPFVCRNQHGLFKREIAWVQRCYRTTQECDDNKCMQAISVDSVLTAAGSIIAP